MLYPGVSGRRNQSCDISTTDASRHKKTQYIFILTICNKGVRTLYTTQGPEDSLQYRNSSRNNDIMIPAVLRYFQRLDFKHSLETSVGEAVTLRAMNNFKRKWERTIWVGFLTLPLICLLFMNTFSWHGFLMDPPQDTYLVVKTQGERELRFLPGMEELSCSLPAKSFEG